MKLTGIGPLRSPISILKPSLHDPGSPEPVCSVYTDACAMLVDGAGEPVHQYAVYGRVDAVMDLP